MNFASDNVVGASRPVLEALLQANDGAEAAYGSDSHTSRAADMLSRVFRARCRRFPRRDRDGRERPGTLGHRPSLGRGVLPRGKPCSRRRVRRARDVHGGCEARRYPRRRREDRAGRSRGDAGALPARAGQVRAALRPVDLSGDRGGHALFACGDRDPCPDRARGGRAGSSRRRALRKRHGRPRLHGGRNDVEGGRGRRHLRRHQERLPRLRGRCVL